MKKKEKLFITSKIRNANYREILKKIPIAGLAILSLLAACATQPIQYVYGLPGFFTGILHGFIAPFSFLGSIFFDIRMYQAPNDGIAYDAGFLLGFAVFLKVFRTIRRIHRGSSASIIGFRFWHKK